MLQAGLEHLERRRHVEDLLAVLDRNDAPVREARTVAAAIHFVHDRRIEVAAAQEIGVQRVHDAPLDGARGGHERLAEHLAAEYLRAADVAALAAEQIDLQPLQLQQAQEIGNPRVHSSASLSRS